ncbi:MAG: YfdX family protein [Burkholderiales bacterium]|nr:YfdX family protein [Burkholderiales bacterium]
MNARLKMTVTALSALLSAGALVAASPALAADAAKPAATAAAKQDAVAAASQKAKDDAMIKTVDEAYLAMREVQAARLAIFNGSPDQAQKFISQAKANMQLAQGKAKDFAINTQKQAASGDAYIPIDTSLALSEGFKATKEKQAAIDKANQHLAKGEHKNAVEVLRLANIDLTESAALIPAKAVLSHINDAATLIGEKKYYEANLALKAAEDAVIVEAYSVDAIPVQGQKVKAS